MLEILMSWFLCSLAAYEEWGCGGPKVWACSKVMWSSYLCFSPFVYSVVMSHTAFQQYSIFLLPLIQQAVNVSCNNNVYSFIGSDDSFHKCQRPWYDMNKGSKLLGIGTCRNQSYTIRGQLVLFYTYSHIGWKLFRWLEHDLSKWKNLFGMCIHKLERFWWSTTEIGHITICIGEGFPIGAFEVWDSQGQ
jgi:hypothetical protein